MKKIYSIILMVVGLTVLFNVNLAAQSPDLFNWQAVVRDASGNPITDTPVTIEFFIRQSSPAGTTIYSESHNPTTTGLGLVNLQVGSGTTSDNFSTIDWSAGPYFLKVDVNGQELSVTQLVSVPYAKYSSVAGNVFSGVYNDLTGKPNLGIYLTSESDPSFSSSAASAITSTNISNWNTAYGWGNHATQGYNQNISRTGNTIYITNSASTVDLTPYLDSKWATGGSNLYYNSGNVGVGTAAPKSTLTVNGASVTDTAIFEVLNNNGQRVFAVYNDGVRITIDETAKGPKGGFAIGGFDGTKGIQEYLRVTSDSTRVYINENAKGPKGGFAIGGFNRLKGALYNYVNLTPDNYLIGHSAGNKITTGTQNFIAGFHAGEQNMTGSDNIFIGTNAGQNNNSNANIFIGVQAGAANTSAFGSVIIGDHAGLASNGSRNVIIGRYTGEANTTGTDNVYVGNDAGSAMTTARSNTMLGAEAGDFAENGDYNVYIGNRAGYDNNGGSNVVIGVNAGSNSNNYSNPNTTYTNNVMIGNSAGYAHTSGSYNVYVGPWAGGSNTSGARNVFIGYQAGRNETGNDKLYIENSNSTSPLIWGDFSSDLIRFNGAVAVNIAPSTTASFHSYDGRTSNDDRPAVLGEHHGNTTGWGIGVKGIGGYMGVYGIANVSGTGNRYGVYGYATGGTTNYAGYFNGNVYVSGSFTNPSDITLKKDIKPISNAIAKISLINGVSFFWKNESELSYLKSASAESARGIDNYAFPEGQQLGVIAQEVEKVFPELVLTDQNGIKSVDYIKLIPVLVEAIKEQQRQIDVLSNRVKQQSEAINNLSTIRK